MKSVVTLRLINFLVQILKCTKTIILFVFLPMKMLDKQTQKQDTFRYKIADIFITDSMAPICPKCPKTKSYKIYFRVYSTWNIELWFHYKVYIHESYVCVNIRKQKGKSILPTYFIIYLPMYNYKVRVVQKYRGCHEKKQTDKLPVYNYVKPNFRHLHEDLSQN